jgi:hypothetical protein
MSVVPTSSGTLPPPAPPVMSPNVREWCC